jgi:hypothetical protein
VLAKGLDKRALKLVAKRPSEPKKRFEKESLNALRQLILLLLLRGVKVALADPDF